MEFEIRVQMSATQHLVTRLCCIHNVSNTNVIITFKERYILVYP